jgi:hypothetical protein
MYNASVTFCPQVTLGAANEDADTDVTVAEAVVLFGCRHRYTANCNRASGWDAASLASSDSYCQKRDRNGGGDNQSSHPSE